MRKPALALLVGSAALAPLTLSAQTVPDPDPFYGIPDIHLNIATAAAAAAPANLPPAGVTWRQSAAAAAPPPPQRVEVPVMPRRFAAPMAPPRIETQVYGQGMAPPPAGAPGERRVFVVRRGGGPEGMQGNHMPGMQGMHMPHMDGRPPMDGHRSGTWQRFERGVRVPSIWWGPRFEVRNWGLYGFPQPVPGGRWIRYHDDALMIDRDGRVVDGRYGWDWDRYGDRGWREDDEGVPEYAGDDGYGPGDDEGYAEEEHYRHGDGREPMHRMMPPPPPRGPAYGYGGYGYGGCGCGYGAPVLVSETIVTEPPVVERRTYVTTVIERVRVAPRRHAPSKLIRRAPAPPRPGERG
jgi:hypothetical protein